MTRRDRGATSLEYVGVGVLAAIVIAAIVLAASPTRVGDAIRGAVCTILIATGVPCDAGSVDPHVPTEPCVISQDGWGGSLGFSLGVSVGKDISVVTERLSNGTYRVTVQRGGKVGAETGIGWDARVEWDGSSYGHDASASAEAHLGLGDGQVYVVRSKEEAAAIEEWAVYQQTRDVVTGGNPVTDWLHSWGTDKVAEFFGLQPPPDPTATTYYGGLSGEVSAHVTTYAMFGVDGQLGVGTVLGYTQFADGSTRVVTKVEGTAQLSGNAGPAHGQLGGTGAMYTEEVFDAKGNRTAITLNYTGDGGDGRTITSYHLPITNQAQQDAATRLMWDPTYFGGFQELAMQQGQVNRVTYDDRGWDRGAVVSGKFMAEAGVELSAQGIATTVRHAEYWDGHQWVPWSACS